jgi:transcriptional regulator with XRE-family HTH domain
VLPKPVSEGLERYQIGVKLRALRLRRKMGLVQLGKQTGLSSAMLSKIERGRLFPTLPTLFRIAIAFGVGLEHFFGEGQRLPIVAVSRRGARDRSPAASAGEGSFVEAFDFAAPGLSLAASYAEFIGIPQTRHSHAGFEIVYVIEGELTLSFDDEEHTLEPGDAIYFEATRPHAYRAGGFARCRALVLMTER